MNSASKVAFNGPLWELCNSNTMMSEKIYFSCLDLDCDTTSKIAMNARVGGPNSCIVKAHSKPWLVEFIYRATHIQQV